MKLLKLLVLITIILNHYNLRGQSSTDPYTAPDYVTAYIESRMNAKYNGSFALSIYFIMDSLVNKIPYYYMDEKFEDPFGTLKGISIFSCQKYTDSEDSSIVGIYKDGNILWDSGPIIFGNILSNLSFCKDINKDGTVDIGLIAEYADFAEAYNPNNVTYYLWILSWDGYNGAFINEYDVNNRKSSLVPGSFELFDENGDGIYEISSMYSYEDEYTHTPVENPPPNYPYVTYGWNGSKYGLWPNVYQLKYGDFYPAIWIKPTIKCKVISKDSLLTFHYTISNAKHSIQAIETINFLNVPTAKIDITSKYQKNTISSFPGNLPGSWYFEPNGLRNYDGLIEPGETKSGYWYKGVGLPTIIIAYLRGLIPLELTREISDKAKLDEIQNNSVKRKTVGLKSIPHRLDTLGFIDTLNIYIDTSCSLGWIKNSLTANKYDSLFNTAKAQLQQNNITGVKNKLNKVLLDVDIDSTSNLTSEAYALIKYNTEYLLEHLPNSNPPTLVVNLENSSNSLITGGSLQYYDGGWKDAVNNGDGTFGINTNMTTLSLRMNYAYGSQTISNIPAQNNTYTFHTTNVSVQLKDSQGNQIDKGSVKYYAGGWRDFDSTSNGVATKELLPNNYSFRMIYANTSNDKQQNIGDNPTVVFQTVKAYVQLKNSQGDLIDEGVVQYYSGGWKDFGTTTNGVVTKELLPNNYSFRMTYAYGSNDKQQNIGDNPTVVFQTVNANVQLKNSLGNLIDEGNVQYYTGGWRDFGTTENGVATKELLPNNYSFRMTYAYSSNDKQQNIGDDSTVIFQTVNANVQLKNSLGNLIDEGNVQYYAGGWREFGTTTNGVSEKELLPNNYSFRMTHEYISKDMTQNISMNNIVVFSTVLCNVRVRDTQGQPLNGADAKYYSGGWREIGLTTSTGEITKELLPANLSFRVNYNSIQQDKTQDLSANNMVDFILNTGQ